MAWLGHVQERRAQHTLPLAGGKLELTLTNPHPSCRKWDWPTPPPRGYRMEWKAPFYLTIVLPYLLPLAGKPGKLHLNTTVANIRNAQCSGPEINTQDDMILAH